MGKPCSKWWGMARALVAGGIALFFLVQTLAFVFSPNGRIAFSNGDAGASIAMAGEVCHAGSDDSGKTPAPNHKHHRHCALCAADNRHLALPAFVLIAAVVVFTAPRPDDAWAPFSHDELTPLPLGWTSSWSSRAPPPIG